MENAKHTPGPWEVRNDTGPTGKPMTFVYRVGDPGAYHAIAVIPDRGMHNHKANARLIAAAPDLLDTLSKLCGVFPTEWPDHETEAHRIANQPLRDLVDSARAALIAITKAKGQ